MVFSFVWNPDENRPEAKRGLATDQACARMHARLRSVGGTLRLSDPFAYHDGARWHVSKYVPILTDYVDDAIRCITGKVPTTKVKYSVDVPQEKKAEAEIWHSISTVTVDIYITPPCVHTLDEFLGIYAHKVTPLLLTYAELCDRRTDRFDLAYAAYYTFAWECVYGIDSYVASGSHHRFMIQAKRKAGI
jgi:hypothetical protein